MVLNMSENYVQMTNFDFNAEFPMFGINKLLLF